MNNNGWSALTPAECVIQATWSNTYLETLPEQTEDCAQYPLVGFDSTFGNRWWVVLNQDAELALINK